VGHKNVATQVVNDLITAAGGRDDHCAKLCCEITGIKMPHAGNSSNQKNIFGVIVPVMALNCGIRPT